MSIKRNVTIDLPHDVYRLLLRSAARNGWTLAKEIEHLILRQFDREYSQAEFDKLVREIRWGLDKE